MSPGDDGGVSRAVVAGALAAFLGGGIWAALLVLANVEVGWVAWGIGALVGFAMSKVTAARGPHLAGLAAGLAAAGLLAGKGLTIAVGVKPAIAREIQADSAWMTEAAMHQMRAAHSFPESVQARLDHVAEHDTLSDALWADMVAAGRSHAQGLSEPEREQLARTHAGVVLARADKLELVKGQLSPWDLLWFGLAIATAWRMMARPEAAAAQT